MDRGSWIVEAAGKKKTARVNVHGEMRGKLAPVCCVSWAHCAKACVRNKTFNASSGEALGRVPDCGMASANARAKHPVFVMSLPAPHGYWPKPTLLNRDRVGHRVSCCTYTMSIALPSSPLPYCAVLPWLRSKSRCFLFCPVPPPPVSNAKQAGALVGYGIQGGGTHVK